MEDAASAIENLEREKQYPIKTEYDSYLMESWPAGLNSMTNWQTELL